MSCITKLSKPRVANAPNKVVKASELFNIPKFSGPRYRATHNPTSKLKPMRIILSKNSHHELASIFLKLGLSPIHCSIHPFTISCSETPPTRRINHLLIQHQPSTQARLFFEHPLIFGACHPVWTCQNEYHLDIRLCL